MSKARDNASGTLWLPGETIQTVTMENLVQDNQYVAGQTITNLNNMSLVITPKKNNSKILIHIRWSGEFNPTSIAWESTFGCSRDGTQIGRPAGGAAGSGIAIPTISYHGGDDANSTAETCIYFVTDIPGTTSPITYRATILLNGAGTVWNNRTVGGPNVFAYESGTSAMTATEIAQ